MFHWVCDPDLDQIVDLQPCEDAYASERVSVLPLLEKASAGQLWMADRLYCTLPLMEACEDAGVSFIISQQSKHPRLLQESAWQAPVVVTTSSVREQTIEVKGARQWRHVELSLQKPTDSGTKIKSPPIVSRRLEH